MNRRVNFADEIGEKEDFIRKGTENQKGGWDSRGFILTDENHNDLYILHNYTIHSYFMAEENTKYGVFYLRKKTLGQTSLLESQEESLGIKKTNASNDKQIENSNIAGLLDKFEKRHLTMKTYGLDFYKNMEDDPENNIKAFKTNFNIDFTNLIFNILILIIMVVQLFLYLDSNTALLRQFWANNHKANEVNTFSSIRNDMITILNETITDCSHFLHSHCFHWSHLFPFYCSKQRPIAGSLRQKLSVHPQQSKLC